MRITGSQTERRVCLLTLGEGQSPSQLGASLRWMHYSFSEISEKGWVVEVPEKPAQSGMRNGIDLV